MAPKVRLISSAVYPCARNKCGAYQRVSIPRISTTHQSARVLRIQALYRVIRIFSGSNRVPADKKMYQATISAMTPRMLCAAASE